MQAKLKFGVATAALMMLAPMAFAQSADPAGDATTQARLAIGQSVEGEISPAADADWYRLSVERGQRYSLTLDGVAAEDGAVIDPTLAIYDSNGAQLSYNDDAEGSLNSALVYTPAQSGDVFVEARGFLDEATGPYRLGVTSSIAPPDDVGNDATTRARLGVGRAVAGILESEGDVDWFRLSARSNQRYRIAVTGGEESGQLRDPVVRVIDREGNELGSADDSDSSLNPVLEWAPQSNGDVFVEVSGFGGANTGRYSLSAEASRAPTDAVSGDASTRGRIALESSVTDNIDFAGDRDWRRIRLQEGQSYRFRLSATEGDNALGDPLLKLFASNGDELAMDDDGGGNLNSYLEFTAPTTGNYFLEASAFGEGTTGAYTLSARSGDTPGDASTDVSLSADGDFREGVLSPAGDHDWYRLDLAEGQGLRIGMASAETADALGDALLAIHGSDGVELARDDDSGEGLNAWLEFVAPAAGTYFVAAQSFLAEGEGRYMLSITAGEIGGSAEGAEFMAANGEGRTSTISSSEDTDWYAVELVEGRPYRFYLDGAEPDLLADPLLTLFDAQGNQVAVDDDGGTGVNSYLSFTSPIGGTFFAAASGFNGATGRYFLRVSDTDVPGAANTDEFLDANGDDRRSRIDIPGDMDAYRVSLEAGVRYVIEVRGEGDTPLGDPFLALLADESGERVDSDDDSGDGPDARLRFTSAKDGTFLIQASGLGGSTGDYSVSIVRQQ